MWSVDVVELLPSGELLGEIDVIGVLEELVELELVGEMRALHLAVQVRAPRLDVDVPHAEVLDVPVELRLPFMATIRSDGVDPKGKLLDHVIDEVDRALLIVPLVDLQRANSSSIIDGRELITADLAVVHSSQVEKLHVYLDLMARDPLGVAASVERSTTSIFW